jgi:hypothetical protein
MIADNPSKRGAAMIDRKPLKREACSGRGTRSWLSVASPAGPRRRRLAAWDEPTHDRPSRAGNWGISVKAILTRLIAAQPSARVLDREQSDPLRC